MSIGDSYKKVRYSDFIYMCRMHRELNVFSDCVKNKVLDPIEHYINPDQIHPDILRMEASINDDLIPFEVVITKSKDAGKDEKTFALFCKHNLKIYNNLSEYLKDLKALNYYSTKLQQDIDNLSNLAMSSVAEDFCSPESLGIMEMSDIPDGDDSNDLISDDFFH